jgi:hypothetical protein
VNDAFDLQSDLLRRSLAEAIAWCRSQTIVASVEETEDVKRRRSLAQQGSELMRRAFAEPDRLWDRLLKRDYTDSRLWRQGSVLLCNQRHLYSKARKIQDERQEIVNSVVARRSEFVPSREKPNKLNVGRLLLYAPEDNLSDGAARYASNGFFDVDNVPP